MYTVLVSNYLEAKKVQNGAPQGCHFVITPIPTPKLTLIFPIFEPSLYVLRSFVEKISLSLRGPAYYCYISGKYSISQQMG